MTSYEYLYKANLVRTVNIVEPDDFIYNLVPHFVERGTNRILDVGCGAGRNAIFLARQGFQVVGLDIASTALKLALERANKNGLRNCVFIENDFSKIPFQDDQFDAAISCYGVENVPLPEIKGALSEMKRVIKHRGLIFATLHSIRHWRFGQGEKLGPKTFMNFTTIEGKRFRFVTHFFEKEDVENLFSDIGLDIVSIEEVEKVSDKIRAHWVILSENKYIS